MTDISAADRTAESLNLLEQIREDLVNLATPPVSGWEINADDAAGSAAGDTPGWIPAELPSPFTGRASSWYRASITTPEGHHGWPVAGSPLVLKWSARHHAEVYVDGRYYGRRHGANGGVTITESAQPGQTFVVTLRVEGRPTTADAVSDGTNTRRLGLYGAHLEIADLADVREAIGTFLEHVDVCEKLIQLTGQGDYVLDQAAQEIDRDAIKSGDSVRLLASIKSAHEALQGLDDLFKRYTISLTSNAHIDMAWLWDREETKQVCHDTFKSVLELMNEYPDFYFAHSQAQSYAWVEELWPDMFAEIKKRVAEGRWEIVGGMWIEPDCNLPNGESFVRQVLHGKRYFQEKFGVDVTLGWNPDSFGYNWAMPQVYKKTGINAFLTQKLTWNDTNVWPHRAFWWESPDGSRIFSFFPTDYVGQVLSNGLIADLTKFSKATGYLRTDHLYGIGDHGGGPTRDMLDRANELSQLSPFPRVKHQRARDFFDTLVSEAPEARVPVWNSELYLEYHRGTFTSQAAIKKGNRDAERLLRRIETFSLLAADAGLPYPAEELDRLWKITLFNQFHDILPGSCIGAAAKDAWDDYAIVQGEGGKLLEAALDALVNRPATHDAPADGQAVTVYNALTYERDGIVSVPLDDVGFETEAELRVVNASGTEAPSQVINEDGTLSLLFKASGVPSTGFASYAVTSALPEDVDSGLSASEGVLENRFVRVEISADGTFSRVFDKVNSREVLAPGAAGNLLQAFVDKPGKWEAWEIDVDFEREGDELRNPVQIEVLEAGPVRARIRTTRQWSKSTFVQDITLTADSPRIDIVNHVDWQDRQRLLKVSFPVNVDSKVATFEVPYSAIERSTGNSTTIEQAQFEVPALQWVDMSADGFGVALLNDSKHGHDIKGNNVRLTLLRSPNSPDPNCDRGAHTFTYSLFPHAGDWREGGVYRAAFELNDPLFARAVPAGAGGQSRSLVEIAEENVLISACKKAEDSGDVILRFFETAGRDGTATIHFAKTPVAAWETDMLENDVADVPVTGDTLTVPIGHNEVKTLKLRF